MVVKLVIGVIVAIKDVGYDFGLNDSRLKHIQCGPGGGRCNRKFGVCYCEAGRYGKNCQYKCPRFSYGPGCVKRCLCNRHRSRGCNKSTGQCICHPGFTGPKCMERCPTGNV